MSPDSINLDINFNPASIIENFRKVDKAYQDVVKGVVGATEKFNQEFSSFAQQMTSVSSRSVQSAQRYVDSLEKQMAKTSQDRLDVMERQAKERVAGVEKLVKRVGEIFKQERARQAEEAKAQIEKETQAMERASQMAGKSRVEKLGIQIGEVRGSGLDPAVIERRVAALQHEVKVEEELVRLAKEKQDLVESQRAAEATERETLAMERQAAVANKTKLEVLEMDRAALQNSGKDTAIIERQTRAVDQLIAAEKEQIRLKEDKEKQRAAEATERETKALERQAQIAGKSRLEVLKIDRQEILASKEATETIRKRVAAMDQLIAVEERANRGGHGGGMGMGLFRAGRDIFEGRMSYGMFQGIRAGQTLLEGGLGAAGGGAGAMGAAAGIGTVGGIVAGLTAAATAGYKAAEAIGELGAKIHETQITTGMSAEEVQRFAIAEKLAGAGAIDAQRFMRGLTQAVSEGTTTGEKARKGLQALGVDIVGLQLGTVTTSQALEQLGEGLKRNGDVFERNAALMEVFKRLGVEGAGVLIEYADAAKKAAGVQILDQSQADMAKVMNDQLVLMKANIGGVKDQLEFILGLGFVDAVNRADEAWQKFASHFKMPDFLPASWGDWMSGRSKVLQQELPPAEGWAISREDYRKARDAQLLQQFTAFTARQPGLEVQEKVLQERKQELDEVLKPTAEHIKAFKNDSAAYAAEIERANAAYEKQKKLVEDIRQAESDRKAIDEAIRRAQELSAQKVANPFALPAELELERQLSMRGITDADRAAFRKAAAGPIEDQRMAQTRRFQRLAQDQAMRQAREAYSVEQAGIQPVNIRELGAMTAGGEVTRVQVEEDINKAYDQRIQKANALYQQDLKDINNRDDDSRNLEAMNERGRLANDAWARRTRELRAADLEREKQIADLKEKSGELEYKRRKEMANIALEDQQEQIKYQAQLDERIAQLRFKGDSPAAGIAASYQIALRASEQLYENKMAEIELNMVGYDKQKAQERQLAELKKEQYRAQEEAQLKLAEMQQQQLDKLKGTIEPLYHTLFTDPKNFGKQLRSTVTQAALHPLESGLSEITARALYPTIYGTTGTGGIAGAFGRLFGGETGGVNDLFKKPLPVIVMNGGGGGPLGTAIPNVGGGTPIFTFGGGSGGGGTFDAFTGGVTRGGPGALFRRFITSPGGQTYSPASLGYPLAPYSSFTVGTEPRVVPGPMKAPPPIVMPEDYPTFMSTAEAPSASLATGPPGFSLPADWSFPANIAPPRAGGGTFNPLGLTKIFGGTSQQMNWANWVKGMRGSFGIGTAHQVIGPPGPGGTMGGTYGTTFGSVANSPAAKAGAGMVGSMLFQAGVFGNAQGTALGLGESTLGGAGIGFSMGGPLGAAIGAAAGFGIGLGEMLAGVESPRNQAKRLARQLYHVTINNSTADQIVSVANSNYAGQVGTAMRSPEVRRMLGLYAAGTGQSNTFVQGLGTPHGASLVESGGSLSQQATYQYGQAFTYASNLPVYGGAPTHVLGGGGGVNLSLNIGGQDAAKFLQGNVVSPDVISTQMTQAMNNSNGRVAQSFMMNEPGGIVGTVTG